MYETTTIVKLNSYELYNSIAKSICPRSSGSNTSKSSPLDNKIVEGLNKINIP